jgi:superfamily II DNA or RNA helicase
LILFSRIAHGKKLMKMLEEKSDKEVFYISGEVKPEEREKIRTGLEIKDGTITAASYQTFALGINIKKLHNIILVGPTKSKIRVLQSIGRGLRKHETKEKLRIIDIIDDLTYKGRDERTGRNRTFQNHTWRHYQHRSKIYEREKFEVKTERVVL